MRAQIFLPELLIGFALLIPALGIWVAIDANSKPEWAFERVGYTKSFWIVLPVVGIFLFGIGALVAAIVWFASVRPKVVAAISGGLPPA